jgi:predicted ATPase
VYVRSLRIQNLRCFREAELTLQYPGCEQKSPPALPNVNLLLGDNGSGKTTVFKAIALAVLAPVMEGSGYVPYQLVRREPGGYLGGYLVESAEIQADLVLHAQDKVPNPMLPGAELERSAAELVARVEISKVEDFEKLISTGNSDSSIWRGMYADKSPAFLLLGYGSTRWVISTGGYEPVPAQRKRRRLRYQRVAGLFEEQIDLTPLTAWLPREERSRFREVVELVNALLPQETRFLGVLEKDEYQFEHRGIRVPFGALSDGYRAYLGWVTDLLYNMARVWPPTDTLRDLRGVVLVDEIDLHLHPEWQRLVVPTISKALPNLQFVLSTHSPIVAGTLSAKNIFVLEMDDSGASTIRQLEESIHGLNADQVLVSPYFNLMTSRAPDAVDGLRRLSRKAMEGDRDAALSFLEQLAGGSEVKPGR